MSFLINGVGYHILVHALPIQVASQSSLTGVVFRAVGMMYLVDLDDTPGYKLTVVVKPLEEPKPEAKTGEEPKKEEPKKDQEMQAISNDAIEQATLEIIEEAKKKLDALARGEFSAGTPGNKGRAANMLLGVGALATDEDAAADKDKSQGLAVPSADAADDDGGAEGETVEA